MKNFKPFIVMIMLVSFIYGLYGDNKYRALGCLGKPADYNQTIKSFVQELKTESIIFPEYFNWKNQGKVTPAKDQGDCGSCWAFTAVGVLESKILINNGPQYDLSEQQLVSCDTNQWGCCGGWPHVLKFWYDKGPMQENCGQYSEYNTLCPPIYRLVPCGDLTHCYELAYSTTDYYTVNTDDINEIKSSVYYDGPGFFMFDVYGDFPDFWDTANLGDVYIHDIQSGPNYLGGHAVLIIGWDDIRNAWLCKNSWGANAGPNHDGTFWIAYSGHDEYLNFGLANVKLNVVNSDFAADFTYTINGLTVSFTDTSTCNGCDIVSWLWDFGDGFTSTEKNPVHTYSLGNCSYPVKLTVTNNYGESVSITKDIIFEKSITVVEPMNEYYNYGDPITIVYSTVCITTDVRIVLRRINSAGGLLENYTLGYGEPGTNVSKTFTIPYGAVSPGLCNVKVKAEGVYGLSERFTLKNPSITIYEPSGGEVYNRGQSITVVWDKEGVQDPVRFVLRRIENNKVVWYDTIGYDSSPPKFIYSIPMTLTPGLYEIKGKAEGVYDISGRFRIN